ncbi:MAG TPA: DUF3078 domain-containing protein [Bacteroidales bacterium]|nr:DUF3078 domain-containing protein [Bacteroidales bacterium]
MKRLYIFIIFLFVFSFQGVGVETNCFLDIFNPYTIRYYLPDTIPDDSLDLYENLNDEERIKDTLMQILGIKPQNDENHSADTISKNDSISSVVDSIPFTKSFDSLNDSISVKESLDISNEDRITHYDTIFVKDTIFIRDTIYIKDTISIADTSVVKDTMLTKELTYEEFINHLEDSLIFEKPDSTYYVIRNMQKLLEPDTLEKNDSVQQAIDKLIQYQSSYKSIDSVKYFLQSKFEQDTFYYLPDDTTLFHLNDSIKDAVRYILNRLPKDSLKLIFKNSMNDSILFKTAKEQIDSVHFKLYDNRGEYALLWIKKYEDKSFDLTLEEGTYLEKAKQQKIVTREVDTDKITTELKKARKVNIIVPIWDIGSTADINFNQGYQSNWVEGGENNLSTLSVLRFNAQYTYGKQQVWDTDIEYKLGYLKAGDNPLQKNDDRFEFNSKYGRTAFNNWYYSLLFNFKTQFLKGYDYPNDSVSISKFMSPGYLVFSLGLDYKPNKNLTVLISPVTSKFTIVSDTTNYDQSRFGVGANEKIRKEIGAYIKAIWQHKITKDIQMENKINFFTNYTNNPQNIDIDWELNLKMKLTHYLKITLNTHLIYDDDVDIPVFEGGEQVGVTKGIQFREVIGIGFSYSF